MRKTKTIIYRRLQQELTNQKFYYYSTPSWSQNVSLEFFKVRRTSDFEKQTTSHDACVINTLNFYAVDYLGDIFYFYAFLSKYNEVSPRFLYLVFNGIPSSIPSKGYRCRSWFRINTPTHLNGHTLCFRFTLYSVLKKILWYVTGIRICGCACLNSTG